MSLFLRSRRPNPRQKYRPSAGGRGVAIAVLVVVSSASFALGFFVGKAADEPQEVAEVLVLPQETEPVVEEPVETLKPVIDAPPPPVRDSGAPLMTDPGNDKGTSVAGVVKDSTEKGDKAFSTQVGAFSDNKDAEKMKDKLSKKGYDAYILKSTDRGRSTIYRVRVGRFDNESDARRMVLKLKRLEGMSAFVTEGG